MEETAPHRAELPEHVDAEAAQRAVTLDGVGEVGAAVLLEDAAVARVEQRQQQPLHLGVVDGAAVELAQAALDAHARRQTDAQVQVAALEADGGAEQFIDFEFAGYDLPKDSGFMRGDYVRRD